MKYSQVRIFSKERQKNPEVVFGMFWVDEDGHVDIDNLPSKRELVEMFAQMIDGSVTAEFTGSVVDED